MTGMNRFDDKKRREVRRRNHIARDLQDRRYRQRIRNRESKYIPEAEVEEDLDEE